MSDPNNLSLLNYVRNPPPAPSWRHAASGITYLQNPLLAPPAWDIAPGPQTLRDWTGHRYTFGRVMMVDIIVATNSSSPL